jgi:predicted GTPase
VRLSSYTGVKKSDDGGGPCSGCERAKERGDCNATRVTSASRAKIESVGRRSADVATAVAGRASSVQRLEEMSRAIVECAVVMRAARRVREEAKASWAITAGRESTRRARRRARERRREAKAHVSRASRVGGRRWQ